MTSQYHYYYVTGGDANRFEARCEETAGTSEQQTELHKQQAGRKTSE